MVRKTKEDAKLTRKLIIKAAREVFLTKGVSKSSLEQVATHAGVTRGAVYWHFENKAALFHAMREQVLLPLIDELDYTLINDSNISNKDPLERIESFMLKMIQTLSKDIEVRETYIVMMSKCEYVDEFATILQQILNNCSSIIEKLTITYQKAQQQGITITTLKPIELAQDTHLFFTGLLHMWVKDTEGTRYRNQADSLIKLHIKSKRNML